MKNGDIVRYYLSQSEYITGVVVEECEDETVWVEHNNGQQRHYRETELVMEEDKLNGR